VRVRECICATVFLAGAPAALAERWSTEASTAISSGLIDRGETLATLNNETSFTLARTFETGEVYGGLYRISPIGGEASAFDEEVDFTIGFAFENSGIVFDASANYLTFLGSAEEASLELAVEAGFEHTLLPILAAFYDVDAEIYGLESAFSPSFEAGFWTFTSIVRGGFVSFDGGSYSYGGVEGIIARPLSDRLSLDGFARLETADEDTFVSEVRSDEVTETRKNGALVGLRFIIHG